MNNYVKVNVNGVVSRVKQVVKIKMFIPTDSSFTQDFFLPIMKKNKVKGKKSSSDVLFENLNAKDLSNIMLVKEHSDEVDSSDIEKEPIKMILLGILNVYQNLQKITIVVSNKKKYAELENKLLSGKAKKDELPSLFSEFYSVEELELKLGDMFSQEVIDYINKYLIDIGIIENDYFERTFSLSMTYEEYISLFSMMINNNSDKVSKFGENFSNLLLLLPDKVIDGNPKINILTDYKQI